MNRKFVARVELMLTNEDPDAPSISDCRFAVLPLETHNHSGRAVHRFVIYDRLLNRIVDGVYATTADDVCYVAAHFNRDTSDDPAYGFRSPNGVALGLVYPTDKHMRHNQNDSGTDADGLGADEDDD